MPEEPSSGPPAPGPPAEEPAGGSPVPWFRRRRPVIAGAVTTAVIACAAAGAVIAAGGGHGAAKTPYADGLPHTAVEVSPSTCGKGWSHAEPGTQVFDLHNTSNRPAEVYLTDARTGAVHGEVEGLAPGTSRPMRAALGNGSYAFRCMPDDADAVTGPTVRVTGATRRGGPGAVPVDEHDLIPPTIDYQKWIGRRLGELAGRTGTLRAAVERGDLGAARAAWLRAHLLYERMGAAYGTFGHADQAINGTDAGLAKGVHDPGFTGFHRLEYGLWHDHSSPRALRPVADRLVADVNRLRHTWAQQRMDPADLGLRAHEIMENTLQFELTGRSDFGSGSTLATARANLDGTRAVLARLRPLLKTRYPRLRTLETWLDRTERVLEDQDRGGHWTPLGDLAGADRSRINADVSRTTELLADVAALCDVRRTA